MSPIAPFSQSFAVRRTLALGRGAAGIAALLGFLGTLSIPAEARDNPSLGPLYQVGNGLSGDYLSALIASDDHDTAGAAAFSREALRYDPRNADLLQHAFVAAVSNGNYQDSFGMADRMLRVDPNNGLAHLVESVRALKAKQFSLARSQLSHSSGGNSPDLTTTLLNAWAYAGAGDSKHALDTLDHLDAGRFGVFRDYHAGLIADFANNPAEAGKRLKAAYDSDKTTLRLVDAYARFAARHGDVAGATAAYQAFDAVLPDHPLVKAALADLKAGRQLDPLIKTAEAGAAEVLYGLGAAGGQGAQPGDELAAVLYLRLALYLAPENALASVTLADIYQRMQQGQQAIQLYQSLPDNSPLRASADIQSALILDTLGRGDEALQKLKDMVAKRPGDIDALTALANLQRSHKNYADAAGNYTKVIANAPDAPASWVLYYFRGISEERQKTWPPAEADFTKALNLFPDQPMVLNYLGYSWADMGMNLDKAFQMLQKAVQLRPTDGYIIDSLGWAYYKLGKYDQAQTQLEKALDLDPGDASLNEHLGDIYWKTGRKLEAQWQWNHARDYNPDPDDLPRILDKIKNGLPDVPAPAADAGAPKKGGG